MLYYRQVKKLSIRETADVAAYSPRRSAASRALIEELSLIKIVQFFDILASLSPGY